MTKLTNPGTGKALEKLADAFLAGEISREQLIEQTASLALAPQVAENDYVCSRTMMCGTHRGDLFGILATGNPVAVSGMNMVQVVDGRLGESWLKNDFMGLMNQLGVELQISR
jgi:hypothetical protein